MKLHILSIALLFMLGLLVTPTKAFAVMQSLDGLTAQHQTFTDDSNVTITPSGSTHTLGWQGLLPFSRGGTGASSFAAGSVLFSNGTSLTQDNSNLFWDDSNNRLGIGTSSPTSALDVSGNAKVTTLTSNADSIIHTLNIGLGGGSVETNTALGLSALLNNTSGSTNLATGFEALRANSTGNNNVALGFRSLLKNTSGSENVAIGYNSFIENLTGAGNVVVGRNAAAVQSDGSTHLTTAFDSIYIGKNVRGNNNNDNNSIVIGTDAIGAGANKAVIGNSSMTDVYFGSASGLANIHAKKTFLGTSTTPGCIIMGDSDGNGVTYLTVNDGVLTASATAPSACQ